MQVIAESGIMADMEHVRDAREIGKYGVMGTPALIINGEVKWVGSMPTKKKLKEWLAGNRRPYARCDVKQGFV